MSKEKKSLKETLSNADFEKLNRELRSEIQQAALDFNEKLQELDVINAEKENAKIKYRRSLDAGLEEAMAESLREVREKNVRAAEVRKELAGFSAMVRKFYERQTKISSIARESQLKAEAEMRAAELALKSAEQKVRNCYSLLGLVNDLNKNVGDFIRVQKKAKETFEGEMVKIPRVSPDGFWLELEDPVSNGSLRLYRRLKQDDSISLPCMLNFRDKETAPVDQERLSKEFEKSESLKSEFGNVKTYLEFRGKIVVQVLENYILRAEGSGNQRQGFAGRAALRKCR